MGEEAVVAVLEVEAGELLDAFEPAVERRAVQVQRAGGGGDVAAVVEERLEGLDELRAAPVLVERRDEQRRERPPRVDPEPCHQPPAAEVAERRYGPERRLDTRDERGDLRLAARVRHI